MFDIILKKTASFEIVIQYGVFKYFWRWDSQFVLFNWISYHSNPRNGKTTSWEESALKDKNKKTCRQIWEQQDL